MPVIDTFTTAKTWSEGSEALAGRSLKVIYEVRLLEGSFQALPSVIRAEAETLGLPVPYVSTYDGLICKTCDAERPEKEQNYVRYTATFDLKAVSTTQQQQMGDSDPLNWTPLVKILVNGIEVPLDEDIDGKAITNSAGVRLLERVMAPDVDLSFEISRPLATIPSWFLDLRRTKSSGSNTITIISGVTYTAAAGRLRYQPVGLEPGNWNGTDYVLVTFRLDVSRPRKFTAHDAVDPAVHNDWDAMFAYLDCGFLAMRDGELQKIKLANGEEPREELLLFGNGTCELTQQDPEDALYIIPKVYTPASYSSLPGVT